MITTLVRIYLIASCITTGIVITALSVVKMFALDGNTLFQQVITTLPGGAALAVGVGVLMTGAILLGKELR